MQPRFRHPVREGSLDEEVFRCGRRGFMEKDVCGVVEVSNVVMLPHSRCVYEPAHAVWSLFPPQDRVVETPCVGLQ